MYTRCIDSNLESGRYISRVGRASRFLSLLPLGASVHQMPFYSRMDLNLPIGRVVHVTSDRLHEQQISLSWVQQVHNAAVVARFLGCRCDTEMPTGRTLTET